MRWKQWGKGWGGGGSELGFGDEEEGEGTRGNMRVMAWRKGWGRGMEPGIGDDVGHAGDWKEFFSRKAWSPATTA